MRKLISVLLLAFALATSIVAQQAPETARYGVLVKSFDLDDVSVGNGTTYVVPALEANTITWNTQFGTAPSAVSVLLQGSFDDENYFTIDESTEVDGEIRTISTGVLFLRARIDSATGGDDITVNILFQRGGGGSSGGASITGTIQVESNNESLMTETKGQDIVNAVNSIANEMSDDGTFDQDLIDNGPGILVAAKDFDGSALPYAATLEGKYTRPASSLPGVLYTMWLDETGAKEMGKYEDAAHADVDYGIATFNRRIDTLASSAGTSGDYSTFNTNASGALWTANTAATNGGCTPNKLISAATTNATNIKGSAGQIYTLHVINLNAATRYIKLYNKATAPTIGTDTPVQTLPIPPNSTTGGGFVLPIPVGMEFPLGIGFGLTTGVADSDTNAVAANEITVNYCTK